MAESVLERLRNRKKAAQKEEAGDAVPEEATPTETPAEEPVVEAETSADVPVEEAVEDVAPEEPDLPLLVETAKTIDQKRGALAALKAKRQKTEEKIEKATGPEPAAAKADFKDRRGGTEIPEAERCMACSGSGESSAKAACKPCGGTGRKKVKVKVALKTRPVEAAEVETVKEGNQSDMTSPTPIENGRLMVSRQFTKSGDLTSSEGEEERIEVGSFSGPPATVGCNLGLTINLGNYESAKIGVICTVPCHPEEAEAAYLFTKKFASARLEEEASQFDKRKSEKGSK